MRLPGSCTTGTAVSYIHVYTCMYVVDRSYKNFYPIIYLVLTCREVNGYPNTLPCDVHNTLNTASLTFLKTSRFSGPLLD